ncbi:MAG: methionine--tRNA ligase [Candidatus Aenigmarchaeota archaeon ex4484_14]|nr:MAG: methionine--tRNA ligase [Candidatus Aenigmarchaeota archaeon ex4484_14]
MVEFNIDKVAGKNEKILVTAALPYANGELHLGHIRSTYVPADIYTRFLRSLGYDAIYVCAADAHGTPILFGAEQAGKSPEDYVKYWHDEHERVLSELGVKFDIFYTTHSPENIALSQEFFTTLKEAGYIYKKETEHFYCPNCKRFLPDRFVRGTCPYCGAEDQYSDSCEQCGRTYDQKDVKDPRCAICGTVPILKKSEHYFFQLTKFKDFLADYLKNNENLQEEVKNYVLNWLDDLKDWDITRDMTWGVPIPGEKNKVLYVWFDAPIGYLSSLKKLKPDTWKEYKTMIHFIGKDIVYHHYLFWPAMLSKAWHVLPTAIPVRGFLKLEGKKFSKSRKWYISIEDGIKYFGADHLRFYITLTTPYSTEDGNFSLKEFQERINNELVGNLGNFIYRTLSFIKTKFDGVVPKGEPDKGLWDEVKKLTSDVISLMKEIKLKRALEKILAISALGNQYFQKKKPWELVKSEKEEDKIKLNDVLYNSAGLVRTLGILMEPFCPFASAELKRQIAFEGSYASAGEPLQKGAKLGQIKPLFKTFDNEEIEKIRKKVLTN